MLTLNIKKIPLHKREKRMDISLGGICLAIIKPTLQNAKP